MKIFVYTLYSGLWILNIQFYRLYQEYLDTLDANRGGWCATPVVKAQYDVIYFFFAYAPYFVIAIIFGIIIWKKTKWKGKTFIIISNAVGLCIALAWLIKYIF